MIRAEKLQKSYGRHQALRPLDLEVAPGELVALVGENGAGKTTALALLSGQLVPDGGRALIGGCDLYRDPLAARRHLGYVGQDLQMPPFLTTDELARFVCSVKEVRLDPQRLAQLLSLAGLSDHADRLVGELSHGMQRKAAWVVALLAEPRALLLDEGLAGLDATSSANLVGEVQRCLERGLAVLWTEHELSLLVERLDRVVVLHGGAVREVVAGDAVRRLAEQGELSATMRRWTAEP